MGARINQWAHGQESLPRGRDSAYGEAVHQRQEALLPHGHEAEGQRNKEGVLMATRPTQRLSPDTQIKLQQARLKVLRKLNRAQQLKIQADKMELDIRRSRSKLYSVFSKGMSGSRRIATSPTTSLILKRLTSKHRPKHRSRIRRTRQKR